MALAFLCVKNPRAVYNSLRAFAPAAAQRGSVRFLGIGKTGSADERRIFTDLSFPGINLAK